MRVEDIKKIGIIGAGVMGTQIGELFAQKGFRVLMVDVNQDVLERSQKETEGKIFVAPSRISWHLDLREAIKDADLVVETITENLDLKIEVFAQLDKYSAKHTLLASNSSAFPITWLLNKVSEERKPKCANMHFLNPVEISQIIEITKGEYTSDETVNLLAGITRKLGKKPVILKKDTPGFIVNRMIGALQRECYAMLEEDVASVEEIDEAIRLGLWLPMGIFQLSDMIGLDVVYSSMKWMYDVFGLEYLKPPDFLKEMVERGELGMKTKKGFYTY